MKESHFQLGDKIEYDSVEGLILGRKPLRDIYMGIRYMYLVPIYIEDLEYGDINQSTKWVDENEIQGIE